MKTLFPWLALGVGLLFSLALLAFTGSDNGDRYQLPLLAALLISEFGLLLAVAAAAMGIRNLVRRGVQQPIVILLILGNLLLAAYFLRTGIALWPG